MLILLVKILEERVHQGLGEVLHLEPVRFASFKVALFLLKSSSYYCAYYYSYLKS